MTTPRTVLITGGNRGIGRAIAEEFVAAGHRVAVTVRSGEGPAGALSVVADVTNAESLDAAFAEIEEKLGPVEVLVANAGITRDTLLMRMTDEEFEEVLDTNLTGSFRVLRRATKGMMKAKFGRVIFIGSVVALLGSAGQVNYSAAKSGLVVYKNKPSFTVGSKVLVNLDAPAPSPLLAFVMGNKAETVEIQAGTTVQSVKSSQVYGTLIAVIPFLGSILSVVGL